MFSKEKILKILSGVIHPGTGKDIVTLGMVSEVTSSDKGISILLTPEKSNDPFLSSVRSTIVKTLKDTLGQDAVINEIKIEPKVVVGKHVEKPREQLLSILLFLLAGKVIVSDCLMLMFLAHLFPRCSMRRSTGQR